MLQAVESQNHTALERKWASLIGLYYADTFWLEKTIHGSHYICSLESSCQPQEQFLKNYWKVWTEMFLAYAGKNRYCSTIPAIGPCFIHYVKKCMDLTINVNTKNNIFKAQETI